MEWIHGQIKKQTVAEQFQILIEHSFLHVYIIDEEGIYCKRIEIEGRGE